MLNLCRASARGLSAAVSLLTLALLSGSVPAAYAAGPIPDKGLEAAVRQQVFE